MIGALAFARVSLCVGAHVRGAAVARVGRAASVGMAAHDASVVWTA